TRSHAAGNPYPTCAVDAGGFQRPEARPADLDPRPARSPAGHACRRTAGGAAAAEGQVEEGKIRRGEAVVFDSPEHGCTVGILLLRTASHPTSLHSNHHIRSYPCFGWYCDERWC